MWFDEEHKERHGHNSLSQSDGSITSRPSSRWRENNSSENHAVSQEQAAYDDEFASPGNKHIAGYTGFIPGIAYKYGQSYDRAADDSMAAFTDKQRSFQEHRSKSSSEIEVHKDTVKNSLEQVEIQKQYKVHHPINCNAPPIVGYTGHISHMTDSECSLGRGYHGAAMKALKLVEKETEEIDAMEKEVEDALDKEMEERDALGKEGDEESDKEKDDDSTLDEGEANGMDEFYGEEDDQATHDRKRAEKAALDKEKEIKAALDRATASNDEYRRGLHTGRRMYNMN